jgi:hypothetical protein
MAITAEASSIRRDVKITGDTPRLEARDLLGRALLDVLDAAITYGGTTDLRLSVMTVVYNYDTEAFEVRWDLAK